ncbi:MAG: hypothetical protein QMD04_14470 [Anaerolineales bacterium]|nr:hypothetical protein [Anaerolineales bacterium]
MVIRTLLLGLRRAVDFAGYAICLSCLSALLGGSSLLAPVETTDRVRAFTRPYEFDYFDWTLDALGVKFAQAAIGAPYYFDGNAHHRIVAEYLELTMQIFQDEHQLNLIYADPQVKDPESASARLRVELSQLKARQAELAPLAEAILQEQVSAVVNEFGLTSGGQPIPPVLFHITPLPYNLIVSRRDKIQSEASISLLSDLSVDRQAELEARVDEGLDVSSLVVPVGGIGSYPTMVLRTSDLRWLTDTIAHEWIHNWLTLRPLGLNYDTTPELRTMNETTASIAGGEIGALILQRYYPELIQAAKSQTVPVGLNLGRADPNDLPSRRCPEFIEGCCARKPFDFRAEMHTTRVTADKLLAEGKIQEAEAYMELRRQFFWENGYAIRKLNQAFFAFHGAYADVPGGAAGEDPVGPAVRQLRAQSPSLGAFLKKIAQMSSFQELQAAISR